MTEVRLFITVSSCRDWKPQFGASLCGIIFYLMQNKLGGRLKSFDLKSYMQASCLSMSRELAFREAIERDFTHWLSLDDDMAFPADSIDRLLQHDKAIVAANYRRKDFEKISGVAADEKAVSVDSTNKTGLEKVAFSAFGLALVDIARTKHIPEPRFEVVWCPQTRTYWTEDMVFSAKAREHGVELFIDHDLSKDIQHIGDFPFQFPQGVKNADKDE